jgi:uncharacterized membrane protein YagU involved in acid resistance
MTDTSTKRIVAGAAIGIVAGLAASFAMNQFQAAVSALSDSDDDREPATDKAANRVAVATTGEELGDEQKKLGGEAVHYALGAALGAAYGASAAVRPEVTAGFGTAFGIGTAAVLDEAAVPATGLGETPWETPISTHMYTLASHLVFGVALESSRKLMVRLFGVRD